MVFDFTFSLSHLLTIISSGVIIVWNFFHVKAKVERAEEKADAAMVKAIASVTKTEVLERQLLKEYASLESVSRIEDRLSTQVDKVLNELSSIRQFLMEKK